MILLDTSVWIEHLRNDDAQVAALLEASAVLSHPFVIGELALGGLRQPKAILALLQDLPKAIAATDDETLLFIEQNKVANQGIGYVDAHLLAAVRLTPSAGLWSLDKKLAVVAERLDLAYAP